MTDTTTPFESRWPRLSVSVVNAEIKAKIGAVQNQQSVYGPSSFPPSSRRVITDTFTTGKLSPEGFRVYCTYISTLRQLRIAFNIILSAEEKVGPIKARSQLQKGNYLRLCRYVLS